jgi:competence protein ComFC
MKNRTFAHLSGLIGNLIEKVADVLMPKEKSVKILEALGPDGIFDNIPRSENFDFETDKIKAIFNYKTPLCRQAIWEVKYRANKKLIRDFSLLLYEYILEELTDLETFNNFKNIILLPIPASPKRTREKGFNQCILICRELIKIDKERNSNNFNLLENFLIKENETEHQARVSNRKKRLENLKGTFSINGNPPSNSSFIIIDDVITTGATMNEAFRALKETGVNTKKIRGFALAH